MLKASKNGGSRLLVTHREQAVLLERAKVYCDGKRVIYSITDDGLRKDFSIPHANLAILFLGQGTSITQEAARLLSEEGVYLAFTGTGGSPLHFGALTSYTGTAHFRRMLTAYVSEELSVVLAKSMMQHRIDAMRTAGCDMACDLLKRFNEQKIERTCKSFEDGLKKAATIEEILGYEGQFTKSLYALFAAGSGMNGADEFSRDAGQDQPPANTAALVNSMIDHGNYIAYGFAGAALWALGIPPHLAVFHGKTRAGGLVFDVADMIKESIILPLAFYHGVKGGHDAEKKFRSSVISSFQKQKILAKIIESLNAILPDERLGPHLNPGRY